MGYEQRLSTAYVQAVVQTGAVPLLLPICANPSLWRQMLAGVDALLLSGGGDPDAVWYGQEAEPAQGYVQPARDSMEMYLARYALRHKIPVLGICRGAQLLAIAAGGTLWQDLTKVQRIQHEQRAPRMYAIHQVYVKPGSLLYRLTRKKKFRVNSLHHQAIRKPGTGCKVSAVAADGIIEAVEFPSHPFALGVQWHPEWLCRHDRTAAVLFTALRKAASEKNNKSADKI